MSWYVVDDVADIPSPALLVFPERVERNIRRLVDIVGDVRRLRPHIKTTKMPDVVRMHLDQGITRFKCATIAEAEMAAAAGATDMLLASPPVGPTRGAFVRLVQAFPGTWFSALADDAATLDALSAAAAAAGRHICRPFVDLDGGMHRTGIAPEAALALYRHLAGSRASRGGLHMYDGHVRASDPDGRRRPGTPLSRTPRRWPTRSARRGFDGAGHRRRGIADLRHPRGAARRRMQPGHRGVLGHGYATSLPDLPFEPALVLLTRVVSRPAPTACASTSATRRSPVREPHPRVTCSGSRMRPPSCHSEEHLVLETERAGDFPVGSVLYRRALARLPDRGAARRSGGDPRRPRRRALGGRGPHAPPHDLTTTGRTDRGRSVPASIGPGSARDVDELLVDDDVVH